MIWWIVKGMTSVPEVRRMMIRMYIISLKRRIKMTCRNNSMDKKT
jgi:hypothetical protein